MKGSRHSFYDAVHKGQIPHFRQRIPRDGFTMLCHQMSRHYRLKQRTAELNAQWNIHPTPEGTEGVQQSLIERLKKCIERMVSVLSTHP